MHRFCKSCWKLLFNNLEDYPELMQMWKCSQTVLKSRLREGETAVVMDSFSICLRFNEHQWSISYTALWESHILREIVHLKCLGINRIQMKSLMERNAFRSRQWNDVGRIVRGTEKQSSSEVVVSSSPGESGRTRVVSLSLASFKLSVFLQKLS